MGTVLFVFLLTLIRMQTICRLRKLSKRYSLRLLKWMYKEKNTKSSPLTLSCLFSECVRIPDMTNCTDKDQFNEDFILMAVALSYVRSRSKSEMAYSLCVPLDLYEEWIEVYSSKIEVRYLPDKHIRNKSVNIYSFLKNRKKSNEKLDHCPGCNSDVIFNHIKSVSIQQENINTLGARGGINSRYGYAVETSFVKTMIERVSKCPVCGLYTIQYVTENLTNSEL